MTAQEYLEQARTLDRQIDSKLMQLSLLRDLSTRTTAAMDGEVVSHTRNVHSLQDTIAKIMDMEREVNADVDRFVDLKDDISAQIRCIDHVNERLVLEYRYLCYLPWTDIAKRLDCSERNVFLLHAEALKKIIPKPEKLQSASADFT